MKLSIIILSWNTKCLLRDCLKSIQDVVDLPTEIIVVDNGSNDGSKEYLRGQDSKTKNRYCSLKFIFNPHNVGYAIANNQGIQKAGGEYILLLNSDTFVLKGALEQLVNFCNESEISNLAVSPLLLLPNQKPQADYFMRFPNLWQIIFYHNPALRFFARHTPIRNLMISKTGKTPFEVDQLPGAALMASKEVWKKVGLLDKDYNFFFEDVDWCYRAKSLGCKLMVVPSAKIIHIGGASWKQKLKENSFIFYHQFFSSMLLFIKKNYGMFRYQIFRLTLVFNFLITLKFKLAWHFLFCKDVFARGDQLNF